MGLYTIKTTELTAGGYPKTGMLSVQTGDPWKKTVMTPNGTITYKYTKEVSETDGTIQIPGEHLNYLPTMAVPNNFWGFMSKSTEVEKVEKLRDKFLKLQLAMNRYLTILNNRFKMAGIVNEDLSELESDKEYPIVQLFWRHYYNISFYHDALTKALNELINDYDRIMKQIAQLEESDIEFDGDDAEKIYDQLETFIRTTFWLEDIKILEKDIDGEDTVSVWNEFVNSSLGMGGLGFNATWDDDKGIVWDGVDVPDGQAKNWPIDGFDFIGLVDPEPEPEPDEEQDE